MKEYLYKEWKYNNLTKYYHLFDSWFESLTKTQLMYYKAYSEGKKSPFN